MISSSLTTEHGAAASGMTSFILWSCLAPRKTPIFWMLGDRYPLRSMFFLCLLRDALFFSSPAYRPTQTKKRSESWVRVPVVPVHCLICDNLA